MEEKIRVLGRKKQRELAEKSFYSQERKCFNCGKQIVLQSHQSVAERKKVLHCGKQCGAKTAWKKRKL